MRKGGMWRRCRQQADARWEKMKVDGKGDDEEAGGWYIQSKLARVEGQGDDSPNNDSGLVELAELRQCAVVHGKEELEVEYGGRKVSGASIDASRVGNITSTRGGIVRTVHVGWEIS